MEPQAAPPASPQLGDAAEQADPPKVGPRPPSLISLRPDALPSDLDAHGWTPRAEASGDENGVELSLLLARSPGRKHGTTGCSVVSAHGELLAAAVSGPLCAAADRKQSLLEVHPEVRALGSCVSRGVPTEGGAVYLTAPPCRRSFSSLALAGIRRVVMRRDIPAQEQGDIQSAAKRLGVELVISEDSSERTARVEGLLREARQLSRPPGELAEGSGEAAEASAEPSAAPPSQPAPAAPEAAAPTGAPPPPLCSVEAAAIPEDVAVCGWAPRPEASGDENGIDLAVLLARNSKCRQGSMGCAIASPSGAVVAVGINGPFWSSATAKRPPSDVHAEANAIATCTRRGVSTRGGTAYITMPPCKRCFTILATAGIGRIVMRKEIPKQDREIQVAAEHMGIALSVVEDTDERRAHIQRLVNSAKRKREVFEEGQEDGGGVLGEGAKEEADT